MGGAGGQQKHATWSHTLRTQTDQAVVSSLPREQNILKLQQPQHMAAIKDAFSPSMPSAHISHATAVRACFRPQH